MIGSVAPGADALRGSLPTYLRLVRTPCGVASLLCLRGVEKESVAGARGQSA
jgi:hypothetical protein